MVRHKKEFENQFSGETQKLIKQVAKFNKKHENEEFLSGLLMKTQKMQSETLSKLKQPTQKSKKEATLKLPLTIKEIDEDPYLSSMLLKNPEFMTPEEKLFIDSFNPKEKSIFLEYLKIKSREFNWMGNGIGSGKFLEDYLKSKSKKSTHQKETSLKEFLQKNMDDENAKLALKKQEKEKDQEMYLSKIKNDTLSKLDQLSTMKTIEKDKKLKHMKFINQVNEVTEELETFKLLLIKQKNEVMINKVGSQNKRIEDDLNEKMRGFKKDLELVKSESNHKGKHSDIDDIIKNYKSFLKTTNTTDKVVDRVFSSIRSYKETNSLTTLELLKLVDVNLYENQVISIVKLEDKFVSLGVLSMQDSRLLCKYISEHFGKLVKFELLEMIIDNSTSSIKKENEDDDYIKQLLEEYTKVKLVVNTPNFSNPEFRVSFIFIIIRTKCSVQEISASSTT